MECSFVINVYACMHALHMCEGNFNFYRFDSARLFIRSFARLSVILLFTLLLPFVTHKHLQAHTCCNYATIKKEYLDGILYSDVKRVENTYRQINNDYTPWATNSLESIFAIQFHIHVIYMILILLFFLLLSGDATIMRTIR